VKGRSVRSGKRSSSKSEVELAVAGEWAFYRLFWCRVSCLAARPGCVLEGGGRESGFGAESLGGV